MDTVKCPSNRYDVAIVGAGHNGLVAANYLADAGLSVVLLDAMTRPGGAAREHESQPLGMMVPVGANWAGMLSPTVIQELDLASSGLKIEPADPQICNIYECGEFAIYLDEAKTKESFSKFFGTNQVYSQLKDFEEFSNKVLPILRHEFTSRIPSRARFEKEVQSVTGVERLCDLSIERVLSEFFADDRILGALAYGAASLSNLPLNDDDTAYCLFHMLLAEIDQCEQAWGFYEGGLQGLIDCLTFRLDRSSSTTAIRLGAKVEGLRKEGGEFRVQLRGEELRAKRVLSSLPVKGTKKLLKGRKNNVEGTGKCGSGRSGQAWFLMDQLPHCCVNARGQLKARYAGINQVLPSASFIAKAYETFQSLGVSTVPMITFSFLRRERRWLLSCYVQFVSYERTNSRNEAIRLRMLQNVEAVFDRVFPGFSKYVLARDGCTPRDLECTLGLPGGHPEHIDMSKQNLFERRSANDDHFTTSVPGISGLYLCGAGVHPGGNVTGIPGRNAAAELLEAIKYEVF